MPSQIQKLEAYTEQLLDAFLRLRETYSMLAPMVFDEQVTKVHSSGKKFRGFIIIRNALFLSCIQDIVKLSFDRDEKAPSIKNLIEKLSDNLCCQLRDRFAECPMESFFDIEKNPGIVEAMKRLEVKEKTELRNEFDQILSLVKKEWANLSSSDYMKGFLTIRDKVTAHHEVQFINGKYQPFDISSFGIKWGDLQVTIKTMEKIVDLLGRIIRSSGFAWALLDKQLLDASNAFWS